MSTDVLFSPLKLGALALPTRIVMPALTRMRAAAGGIPTALNAEYYAQRASAGLIITEATAISVQGHGYPAMPGIHSEQQIAGWRTVTSAVHARGGRIVQQLVHHGRWSHSSYNPDGSLPVAPSAIAPPGTAYTAAFAQVPYETPRALETAELPVVVEAFRCAARNAMAAGFDAVEIHGANGFLLDQFLQDGSNHRTDTYGGSIENRARLLFEVIDAVVSDLGAARVAVRLSPHGNLGGLTDSNPVVHFNYVVTELGKRGLAYLHLIEPRASSAGLADNASIDSANNAALFRKLYGGPMITAGGYTPTSGARAIEEGLADAVAFGRMFIANPDLVERIRTNAPLNQFDRSTAYGGDAHGYTDYPTLPPGHHWREILRRSTMDAFSSEFTAEVVLEGSVVAAPIVGPAAVRRFFDATRTMYETIEFLSEERHGDATHLEWRGQFRGAPIAGATTLVKAATGRISNIVIYHRPLAQVTAFSTELSRRLQAS
jgi:N-ethylmaleimide reductase